MELFDTALKADEAEFKAHALALLGSRVGFDGLVWGGGFQGSAGGLSITRSMLHGRPDGLISDYPSNTVADPTSTRFLTQPDELQNISTHRFYNRAEFAQVRQYLDHYRVRQLQLAGMRYSLTQEYSWIVCYREEESRPFEREHEAGTRDLVRLILLADYFRRSVHEHAGILTGVGPGSTGTGQFDQLTHKQRSVLHYLEKGWPNKLIAHHLAISENTLKTHLKTVFRVLGVHSRSQAVIMSGRLRDAAKKQGSVTDGVATLT